MIELPAGVTFVRDLDDLLDSRFVHARMARRGVETRLSRGAYIETASFMGMTSRQQYLMRICATAETRRVGMVLSHWSAAAIHGLPIIGPWPRNVHFTVGRVSGGRSRNGVIKHALELGAEDVVEKDGFTVTSIARTVLDMAVAADNLTATMIVDRSLLVDRFLRVPPMATREDLWAAFERRGNFRGQVLAAHHISFGATRAESPLESVSRANMRIIGCPMPELQVPFWDSDGFVADVDFYWRRFRTAGESDGRDKYLNPVLLAGKSTAQALVDEKFREDRIRALGERVSRWPWEVGVDPSALRARLRRDGLPIP